MIQFHNTIVAVTSLIAIVTSKESIIIDASCAGGLTSGNGVVVRYGSGTSILGFLAYIP